jgi:cell division transport system permease protein
MVGRLAYFVGRTASTLREAPGMSLLTSLTIAAARVVRGGFAVGFMAVDGFTAGWGRVATVTAYIADDVPADTWPGLRDAIAALPSVERATLVTPEEALEAFKARGQEARALVEGVSSTLLPASIEVVVAEDAMALDAVRALADTVAGSSGIADVDYGQEDHARLSALARIIRIGGAAAALLVALATAFIVSSTIRLTVYARRAEIGILKLVGATNGFVRLPFLLEGAVWGACGGGAAALFLWLADRMMARHLDLGAVLGVAASVRFFAPELGFGIFATGVLLGVAGALLAVRRFLDVEPA